MMQAEQHRRESTSGEGFFMDFFVIYSFSVAASMIAQQSFQRQKKNLIDEFLQHH